MYLTQNTKIKRKQTNTMKEQSIELSSIDITPSWKVSVEIAIIVLSNPKSSNDSKQVCREQLLRLAAIVDNLKK